MDYEASCALRFLLQPPLIVRRQYLSGHFRRRLDDETAEFAFQIRHCAFVLDRARFARLRHDLLRRRDGFLLFTLGQMRALCARFVDHFLRLRVRFGQDLSMTLFRFRELLSDLFRVQLVLPRFAAAALRAPESACRRKLAAATRRW